MFQIGDKVAHPMHGAGVVEELTERSVDGEVRQYYAIRMACGEMTVLVPCGTAHRAGLRPLYEKEQLEQLLTEMHQVSDETNPNWNQRYRENVERLKSGDLLQVASVAKSLALREETKDLSGGERKMLIQTRQILVSEVMLSLELSWEESERRVKDALC